MDVLIEQTDAAIKDVSEYIEEYETFISWLAQAESDFEDFNDSEQAAFAKAFSQFTVYTEEPVSPDEVVKVRGDMREVFREPLLQAILDAIRDISERLGISLEDSVLDSFNNEMQSWSRTELLDCREAFEEVDLAAEGLSDSERAYIQSEIYSKPHILLEPAGTVLPIIESTTETGAQLRELSTILATYDWLTLEERHIGPFHRSWLGADAPASHEVESIMDSIDESVDALERSRIPASNATSSGINTLTEHPKEDFLEELQELSETLETQAAKGGPLEYISESINIVDSLELETLDREPLVEIDETLEEEEPDSINEVVEVVTRAREEYSEWVSNVSARWKTYRSAVDVLREYTTIEEPAEFTDQDEFTTALFKRPPDAIHAYEQLVSGLEEKRQMVGGDGGLSEESIELLFDLIEQQAIPYGAYSQEAFEDLDEVIALEVRIDE